MGGKTILFLGVTISAVYLYFAVSNHDLSRPSSKKITKAIEEVENSSTANIPSIEETEAEPVVFSNENERLSIPAFGFIMAINDRQIAAVMSNEDKSGELAKYIEILCESKECTKDINYNKQTKSATWQKEMIEIIKLLADGSIDNGSVFIEGDLLKISGAITDQNKKDSLNKILENIKAKKLNIQNNTTLKTSTTMATTENIETINTITPTTPAKIVETKEVNIVKPTQAIKQNSQLDADARVRAILEEFRKNK